MAKLDEGITQEDIGGLEGVSNSKRAKVCSTERGKGA